MKKATLLKALLLLGLLAPPLSTFWGAGSLMAQDYQWVHGYKLVDFSANNLPFDLCYLPTDPAANRYHGAVAQYCENAQYDETGKLLFFIIDGNIYDQGGYLMGDNDVYPGTCHNCLMKGLQEVSIILVPGSCDKYFILMADAQPSTAGNKSQLAYCILDLSMDNPFFPDRKGRVLQGNEVYAYPQFYNLVINGGVTTPQVDGQSLFKIADGNHSPSGYFSGRLSNVKHVVLDGPSGTEPKTVFAQTCVDLVSAQITANGIGAATLIYNVFPSDDNSQTFSGQLVVAKGPDGIVRLAGTMNETFPTTGSPFENTIELNELQFSGGVVSTTASFAINTNVTNVVSYHGKTRGLAFSPNGRYLYFAQEFAPKVGYIDVLDPLHQVHDLGAEIGVDFSNYGSGRLAVNNNPTNPSSAVYFPKNGGMGWLGNPNNPLSGLWHVDVTGTSTAFNTPPSSVLTLSNYTVGGVTPIPNYLVNAQNHRDQQITNLEEQACCQKNEMIPEASHTNSYSGTNTFGTAWKPYDNGLTDPIICKPAPDGHVYFEEDFHVEAGARLYVDSMDWRFAPNARLIVDRGGYLRMTNCTVQGTLDADCEPQRWPGVRVEGTTSVDQQPSINGDQGYFYLSNTVIKNAMVGVWCARENQGNEVGGYNGGIVVSDGSTFKNCITGTKISNYNGFTQLSNFSSTTFVTDNDWPDNLYPYRLADISYTKTVYFINCSFANTTPYHSVHNGTGVSVFNGQVKIQGSSYNTSYFSNLYIGVANAVGVLTPSTVNHMAFINNQYGILDYGTKFSRYSNNQFTVPDFQNNAPTVGMYLWQSQLYTIERNAFKGTPNRNGNLGIYFLGYTPGSTGWAYAENQIYDNQFRDLYAGNMVRYIHRGLGGGGEEEGLALYCGDYTNNIYDITLQASSIIRPNQGYPSSQLSGNRFLDPANCSTNWDWNLDPQWNVISGYSGSITTTVFRNNDPICDVLCQSWPNFYDVSVLVGPWTANGTCGAGDLDNTPNLNELVTAYNTADAQQTAAENAYTGYLDAGDQQDLLTMLSETEAPMASSVLRDALLASSPLSDEILLAMLDHEPAMDPWHLTQVLTNNVNLNPDVIETARESGLLSPFYMGIVDDAQEGSEVTSKQLLEQEITQRRIEKTRALRGLGYLYATDTTLVGGLDSLSTLMLANTDPVYSQIRKEVAMAHGQWATDPVLSDDLEEISTWNGWANYQDIQNFGANHEGNWHELEDAEVEQLHTDMLGGESGAAYAAAILWLMDSCQYIPEVALPSSSAEIAPHYVPNTNTGAKRPEMALYPNPAQTEAYLTWPVELQGAHLAVVDAQGRILLEQIATGNGLSRIDLRNLPIGFYKAVLREAGLSISFSIAR